MMLRGLRAAPARSAAVRAAAPAALAVGSRGAARLHKGGEKGVQNSYTYFDHQRHIKPVLLPAVY